MHQNAFDEVDTYSSLQKQSKMLKAIVDYANLAQNAAYNDFSYEEITSLPSKRSLAKMKYISENELDKIDKISDLLREDFASLMHKEEME